MRVSTAVPIGAARNFRSVGSVLEIRSSSATFSDTWVAKEVPMAIQKGMEIARKNMFNVPMAGQTIIHPIVGIQGASRVLLKPAAADLLLTLWCLKYGKERGLDPANPPEPPRPGLTSAIVTEGVPAEFYRAYGFHVCGPRAVRIDMLERLADLIRPLLGWRAKEAGDTPPKGATGDGGFTVVPEMMSILGCSTEELGQVLTALGFRSTKREVPRSELAAVEGGEDGVLTPGHTRQATVTGIEPSLAHTWPGLLALLGMGAVLGALAVRGLGRMGR